MAKFGIADLWELYSMSTHADVRGVHQWLSTALPDVHPAHAGIAVMPRHDDAPLANALLTEVATECRDMAAAMVVCGERTPAGIAVRMAEVHALDPSIEGMIMRYYAPAR